MTKNYYRKLSSLDALDEFLLYVDRILSKHALGDNGQFPQLLEAVYLYIFTGWKALLWEHLATVIISST